MASGPASVPGSVLPLAGPELGSTGIFRTGIPVFRIPVYRYVIVHAGTSHIFHPMLEIHFLTFIKK